MGSPAHVQAALTARRLSHLSLAERWGCSPRCSDSLFKYRGMTRWIMDQTTGRPKRMGVTSTRQMISVPPWQGWKRTSPRWKWTGKVFQLGFNTRYPTLWGKSVLVIPSTM